MRYNIDNFIGVFEDVFTEEECQRVINYFESNQAIGKIWNRKQLERNGGVGSLKTNKDDYTLFTDPHEVSNGMLFNEYPHLQYIVEKVRQCYEQYNSEYDILQTLAPHSSSSTIRIQKTLPGGGYHVWHCEHGPMDVSHRLLAWSIYLNDVEEGGETEFLYQKKRFKAKRGTVLIFPAAFTHTHRGNPPLSGSKYIVTSWIQFTA